MGMFKKRIFFMVMLFLSCLFLLQLLKICIYDKVNIKIDFARDDRDGIYYLLSGWKRGVTENGEVASFNDSKVQSLAVSLPNKIPYRFKLKLLFLHKNSTCNRLEVLLNNRKIAILNLKNLRQCQEFDFVSPAKDILKGFNKIKFSSDYKVFPTFQCIEMNIVSRINLPLLLFISLLLSTLIIILLKLRVYHIFRFNIKFFKLSISKESVIYILFSSFMIGFILLLFISSCLMSLKHELIAEKFADISFLFLILGVLVNAFGKNAA
jgi:hypothetical protein